MENMVGMDAGGLVTCQEIPEHFPSARWKH